MLLALESDEITRTILGNVPGWMAVTFYVTVTIACLWAAAKFYRRFWQYQQGRSGNESFSESATSRVVDRVFAVARYLTFHQQLLRDRYAGLAHLLLFYGFGILFVGTCLVFLEHDTPLHFFYGRFYLIASLIIDLGGIAFLIGLSMFLYRRMFGRSRRILRRFYVAALLWVLLAIGISGFLLEGARIAIDRPDFEQWSVAGYAVARVLNLVGIEAERATELHRLLWGFHAAICVVFFALLPWRFFSHLIFAPMAWAYRTRRPRSALRPVVVTRDRWPAVLKSNSAPAVGPEIPMGPGATSWQQLPWIDLLQADACTTCGRCNEVCPAHAAEKPLRPRDIVLGIRESMNQSKQDQSKKNELSEFISDDALWSCTTCGACNEACPVGIEVYDKIVELRRGQVESGTIPVRAKIRVLSAQPASPSAPRAA